MKLIKLLPAALLFTAVTTFVVSCKKENTKPRTTLEKITGKWKLQSSVTDHFYAGTSHITTYIGTTADYADFRNDNKVYSFVNSSYDTSAYGIISETKIWIDDPSVVFEIQTLTDTDLKLYMKMIYSASEYDESRLEFNR